VHKHFTTIGFDHTFISLSLSLSLSLSRFSSLTITEPPRTSSPTLSGSNPNPSSPLTSIPNQPLQSAATSPNPPPLINSSASDLAVDGGICLLCLLRRRFLPRNLIPLSSLSSPLSSPIQRIRLLCLLRRRFPPRNLIPLLTNRIIQIHTTSIQTRIHRSFSFR
jgi:hypothetical protein